MNFQTVSDWRNKRNLLNHHLNPYNPIHYSIASYSSTGESKKNEMDSAFSKDIFLNNLCLIPDPLQKNLADTLVSNGETQKKMGPQTKGSYKNNMDTRTKDANAENNDSYPSLMGLGNFISNAINAISGLVFFGRDNKTPPSNFEDFDGHEAAPALDDWQSPKIEELNKSARDAEQFNSNIDRVDPREFSAKMNVDSRTAVAHCEDKLNKVRSLLNSKSATSPMKCQSRMRRPRKVFVEPNSVEESFEDAFSFEDLMRLENEECMEYISAVNVQNPEMLQVEVPKIKTVSVPVQENVNTAMKIEEKVRIDNTSVPAISEVSSGVETKTTDTKEQLVSSCEDKVSRLKALFQQRRKSNTKTSVNSSDSVQEPVKVDRVNERPKITSKSIPMPKVHDKRFKNTHRLSVPKRPKATLKRNIQDDMSFAAEIETEHVFSVGNSPAIKISPALSDDQTGASLFETVSDRDDSFNEVTGCFNSTPTDSDDSFQIVFSDSPSPSRVRKPSECDSEDSFIVFESTPDDCYTSSDVFGKDVTDSEESDDESSDSDSDIDNMERMTVARSNSLSKSFGDLTDDSLYQDQVKCEDEVDCAFRTACEIPSDEIQVSGVGEQEMNAPGLLLNEARKRQKQLEPPKRVHFSPHPPKVRIMCVWAFAARQARAGHWERHTIDRERFKRRIEDVEMAISWVLKPQHRTRVMFQRFMPWWNAQKREEIAEKKQKDEEDKLKREADERLKLEEAQLKEAEKKQTEEENLRRETEESLKTKVTQIKDSNIDNNVTDINTTNESKDKIELNKICTVNINVKSNVKHIYNNTNTNINVKTPVQTKLHNDLNGIVDIKDDFLVSNFKKQTDAST